MKKLIFILISINFIFSQERPVDLVNPLVDSANSRWFFFSSATRPFGMVNLSPDMLANGAWDSGYRYNQKKISFFSHVHAWQLSGIPVLPFNGKVKAHMGPSYYGSNYSHQNEKVSPGYHSIHLEDYNIKTELTSTKRVGFHRYNFPNNNSSSILIDLGANLGPSGTKEGYIIKKTDFKLNGYTILDETRRRPKPTTIYFSIEFNKPMKELSSWENGVLLGKSEKYIGEKGGVYALFDTENDKEVLMKVGISYVSINQAELNLKEELNHWDFDRIVFESKQEWNSMLTRIEVKGGTKDQKVRFYTDLWHALQGRRVISDYNGKYSDMTGDKQIIRQIPLDKYGIPKFNHYNSDSFWGAQWTINILWHLVYPEISEEFINSMLLMYKDGGLIPRGPSGGNYTYVMTGASSTPFIVSAYMKGIKGFDVNLAYKGMVKNHLPGGIMSKSGYEHETKIGGGLNYYINKGFVPFPLSDKNYGYHQSGPGMTLEYAYQDWTLAQMAKHLDKKEDYSMFIKRSQNYKNIYDSNYGWMRGRNIDGSWTEPYDPLFYEKKGGFVEATPASSTWFVPHDLNGLAKLMGGREIAAKRLNQSFLIAEQHNFVSHNLRTDKFVTSERRKVFINYGNQPSMQTAFIFNYFGQPWLTQKWSRAVIEKVYSDVSPQKGYSGDEDQGLMGSLAVIMKMGLFQMNGGTDINPTYDISSPIFDEITIHLNKDYYSGKSFKIISENNSSENIYIQNAYLNDIELNQSWLYHKDIVKGGVLKLKLGNKPNYEWATVIMSLPKNMSE